MRPGEILLTLVTARGRGGAGPEQQSGDIFGGRGERWAGLRERSGTGNYISTEPFRVSPDFHDNELLFRSALLATLDGSVGLGEGVGSGGGGGGGVLVVVVVGYEEEKGEE